MITLGEYQRRSVRVDRDEPRPNVVRKPGGYAHGLHVEPNHVVGAPRDVLRVSAAVDGALREPSPEFRVACELRR